VGRGGHCACELKKENPHRRIRNKYLEAERIFNSLRTFWKTKTLYTKLCSNYTKFANHPKDQQHYRDRNSKPEATPSNVAVR
jgi:hypothetical protein